MRILYGVAGEGLGHAFRSIPIIEHLQKNHDIVVVSSGRVAKILSKKFKVIEIKDMSIHYENNEIKNFKTTIENIVKIPSFFKDIKTLYSLKKFDLVITDFEPIVNLYSIVKRIPSISIDNNHAVNKLKIDNFRSKRFLAKQVVKFMTPFCKKYMITTFFGEPKDKKTIAVPPVIRKEILDLKPKKGKDILVYQTSKSYEKELIKILTKINAPFKIYGFNKNKKIKNLEFKKFSEKEFKKDLKNCKAVITNGGFTLITEAMYLGKPVLSVPVKKHFEQQLNAYYLDKKGYGMYAKELNPTIVKDFLNKQFKKYNYKGNKVLFNYLDSALDKYRHHR